MQKKLSEEDKLYKDRVFDFFEHKILGYTNSQHLQKKSVLSVLGLTTGQNIINNSHEKYGEYSFREVYYTCVFCKDRMQKALSAKNFDGESQTVAYLTAIVRNNLNEISNKLKDNESSKKKIEVQETIPLHIETAKYTPKGTVNDKFKDMW